MVVGVVTWDLHLNGCQSLKDKRRIMKSLKDRLHNRFNISVAEMNHENRWQRAELSCCIVATDTRHAQSVLNAADDLVGREPLARVIDSQMSWL